MEKRRFRTQSIVFTLVAEDIILDYMEKNNVTFNKAVNKLIEKNGIDNESRH